MSFTSELWASVSDAVIPKVMDHGFIKGLQDGSLDESIFRDYIVQDHKYLEVFSKNLSMLSIKAPHSKAAAMFANSAVHVLTVENSLHHKLLAAWDIEDAELDAAVMQPACLAYTTYLQSVVQGQPFYEGLAAMLPCYWIYQYVGQELKKAGSPNPKYQAWIDMYGGDDFDQSVVAVLALMDSLALNLHEEQRDACKRHFFAACRYEYMFWDGPFRKECWPL